MEKEENEPHVQKSGGESEDAEPIELVLFQVPECYVYIVSLATFCSRVFIKIWFCAMGFERNVRIQFTTE